MSISTRQHELLAEIQALAMSAGMLTGRRVAHEAHSWPDGALWSEVRVISDGQRCEILHESTVTVSPTGAQRATFTRGPANLIEQRDALVDWITANRKQEAA